MWLSYSLVKSSKVSEPVFLAVIWTTAALATCFTIFRLYVRIHSFRKLFLDDFLVVIAWLMLLIQAVLLTVYIKPLYIQYEVLKAIATNPSTGLSLVNGNLIHAEGAIQAMFTLCLWSIKASFMAFFYRLNLTLVGHRICWWFVLAIVFATFAATLGMSHFQCFVHSVEWTAEHCSSESAQNTQLIAVYVNSALDIFSDAAITMIPILLLWNISIPRARKCALAGLLSLTLVIVVFSIMRVIMVTDSDLNTNISWLWLWSFVECSVAIIVATLAAFRQLYVKNEEERSRQARQAAIRHGLENNIIINSSSISTASSSDSKQNNNPQKPPAAITTTTTPVFRSLSHNNSSRHHHHHQQQQEKTQNPENQLQQQQPYYYYYHRNRSRSHSHITTDIEKTPSERSSDSDLTNLDRIHINRNADMSNDIVRNSNPIPQDLQDTYSSWMVTPEQQRQQQRRMNHMV